jgi:quercetin dioxygenase-like cupin family protein
MRNSLSVIAWRQQTFVVGVYPKKEIKIMKAKATLIISVLVLFSTVVWATPGSGVLFNTILNRAQVSGGLHSDARGEAADGSFWHLQLKTEGAPSDVIVQDQELAPGGYGGWHTHPGPVILTVSEGTASFYESDCVRHDYPKGTAFIEEAGVVHNLRNESTTENLRLANVFIVPAGAPRRIEADQPPTCSLP